MRKTREFPSQERNNADPKQILIQPIQSSTDSIHQSTVKCPDLNGNSASPLR